MAKVKVTRCTTHKRFMFNGVCLACRKEANEAKIKLGLAIARGEQS